MTRSDRRASLVRFFHVRALHVCSLIMLIVIKSLPTSFAFFYIPPFLLTFYSFHPKQYFSFLTFMTPTPAYPSFLLRSHNTRIIHFNIFLTDLDSNSKLSLLYKLSHIKFDVWMIIYLVLGQIIWKPENPVTATAHRLFQNGF